MKDVADEPFIYVDDERVPIGERSAWRYYMRLQRAEAVLADIATYCPDSEWTHERCMSALEEIQILSDPFDQGGAE